MLSRRAHLTTSAIVMAAASFAAAERARAQCTLLLWDDFQLGPRPKGNGNLRDAQVHDGLNGYWPLVGPPGAKWIAPEGSQLDGWIFSASSMDPLEPVEPFPDLSSNGTASGQGHAAAWLPFTPPSVPFTLSVNVVPISVPDDTIRIGFSGSSVTNSNLDAFGRLWLEVTSAGVWSLHAGGSGTPIASGLASMGSALSGFTVLELTYDPGTQKTWGKLGQDTFGPLPAPLGGAIQFAGLEAHNTVVSYQTVNHFVVRTGPSVIVSEEPVSVSISPGGTARFSVATTAGAADPIRYTWLRAGFPIADGPTGAGSVVSGAGSGMLTIQGASLADADAYSCVIATTCGVAYSQPATLSVCAADFDHSGFVDIEDYSSFVAAFEAGDDLADFDGSGFVDTEDFDAFVRAFETGC